MTLADIIALAKQGYKPSDIRELIALQDAEPAPVQDTIPAADPQPEPEPETEAVDYKKLYEEQSLRNKELETTVSDLQKKNVNTDIQSDLNKEQTPEEFNQMIFNLL